MTVQYGFTLCRNPGCKTTKEPGYADRGLCQYDEATCRDAIGALPSDWRHLQDLIFDKGNHGPGAPTGTFGPSEPIDYGAEDLASEIAYTAVVWELTVRETAGLAELRDMPGAGYADLVRATTILDAHWSVLIAHSPVVYHEYNGRPALGDGIDAILALAALHRRARNRIGFTKITHTVPGACGTCGRETLRHRDEEEFVTCATTTCKAWMTWAAYENSVLGIPDLDAA